MDPISYSKASQQEQRIKKFVAQPDSVSGLVTMPSVIASGETTTIPAGRTVVHPNLQVDGVLDVQGSLFVPAGGTMTATSVDVDEFAINGDKVYATTISIPSSQMLLGDVSLTNQAITNGFGTTLYTGNGSTQTVTTDIPMSGQWGNDASETYGGLVWVKYRNVMTAGYQDHHLIDTVRGVGRAIASNTTALEALPVTGLTAFNTNGFSLGSYLTTNQSASTYAAWNFGTTHIRAGTTNHGKAYTEHYNPFTGFTIIKYEGSGTAGHEIPHSLGRKLGLAHFKNLTDTSDWVSQYKDDGLLLLNQISAETVNTTIGKFYSSNTTLGASGINTSTKQYILYGWANSYYDEGQLQGNYEIGTYTGTGVAGNKVTTRGKPAWVMVKRLDATGNWIIVDILRSSLDSYILANTAGAEGTGSDLLDIATDGFIHKQTSDDWNALGGQYLYMVAYDNDSGSGKSKYYRTTTTSNLSIANRVMQFSKGVIDGSFKNSSEVAISETPVPTNGYVDGYQYLYKVEGGSWYSTVNEPKFGTYVATKPNDNCHVFIDGNWYLGNNGGELVTNGTFDTNTTGWTANSATLSLNTATLLVSNTTTSEGSAYQTFTTEIGKKYTVRGYCGAGTSTAFIKVGTTGVKSYDLGYVGNVSTTMTIHSFTFIATTTTVYLSLSANSGGTYTAYFDNVSVFAVEPTLSSVITPTITYLPKKVLVASGDIVTVDDFKYPSLVQKYVKADKVECTEFKHNGIDVGGFLGVGQTWQDVTASRTSGVTYTNTTGKPIQVNVSGGATGWLYAYVGGIKTGETYSYSGYSVGSLTFVVKEQQTYYVTGTRNSWFELR